MLLKTREKNLKRALQYEREWEKFSANTISQSQMLSWQSKQRLEWLWAHWQEAWSLLPKELEMVLRFLEVRSRGNFPRSHRFNSRLHFQDSWISDHLTRSKCMTYGNGSCHICGWTLSEEQAMNKERWDQTSWDQSDLYHIMICLAVSRAWAAKRPLPRRASLFTWWWFCLHLNFSWSLVNFIWRMSLHSCALLRLISSQNSLICWLRASYQNFPSSGCYYPQPHSGC